MTDEPVTAGYQRPAELYAGLRLHQNEHTGGCSPRVLAALAGLTRTQIAIYPPYAAAIEACARHFGVSADDLLLVNGLDEGILGVAIAYLRTRADGVTPEVIIPRPAFEVFEVAASALGAAVVDVMPQADFAFPLERVLAAIGPRTRAVIVTNPNNPTGVSTALDTIATIARRLPPGAVVFVDEAYVDFGGDSFVGRLPQFANVIVGRTFSKAYGLAGLRAGVLLGQAATIAPLRTAVPVYSLNVAAAVALVAALEDDGYRADYLRQVRQSKAMIYDACRRWRLPCWPSDGNFVLVRSGAATAAVLAGALARGIYLKDRSGEPGCAGCIRITAGVVEHTARVIAAMEEVLCGGR